MEACDIYVYIPNITRDLVDGFISSYLGILDTVDTYFTFPRYGRPKLHEFDNIAEVYDFVLSPPIKEYTFYLKSSIINNIHGGIIIIFNDESGCLGLTTSLELEKEYIYLLRERYQTDHIFICYTSPPPQNKEEVEGILKRAHPHKSDR